MQSTHPALARSGADALALASRWTWGNRLQALKQHPRRVVVGGAAMVVGVIAAVTAIRANADAVAHALSRTIDYPLVLVVALGWLVAVMVARHRRVARRDATRSWLAALPLATQGFERRARHQLGWVVLVAGIGGAIILAGLAALVALPVKVTGTLAVLIGLAVLAGGATGWSIGGQEPRMPRLRLPGDASLRRDARYSLGRWPLRHSRAHADIGLHARAIGALLLSLPIGTPGIAALCVIVIGLMAFTIRDVLLALLATLSQAGGWLRSLPLAPARATRQLAVPGLVAVTSASCLLALALLPAGITPMVLALSVVATVTIAIVAVAFTVTRHTPFKARP